MKCDLCGKNEALVHLTQDFGSTFKRIDLCEECAKKHGVNDPTGFALLDLLQQMKNQKKPR
jgi:protein-arginine kinase activator protein McsA